MAHTEARWPLFAAERSNLPDKRYTGVGGVLRTWRARRSGYRRSPADRLTRQRNAWRVIAIFDRTDVVDPWNESRSEVEFQPNRFPCPPHCRQHDVASTDMP